jgi:hypothetical protein
MRTTVTLDDELYERARKISFEQRRTLGDVLNELIRRGLAAPSTPRPQRTLGTLRGRVWIADDFDETPGEILDAIDRPL